MAPLQSLSQEGTIDCIHIKWETLMRQLERTAFPCLTCCVQPGRAGEQRARSVSCVNEAGAWPTWDRGQESSWLVEEKGILRSVAVWSRFLPGETEASPCLSPQSLLLCCEHGEGHRAAPAPQLGQGSSCPHPERGGMLLLLHRAPNPEARLCLRAALASTPICQPRFQALSRFRSWEPPALRTGLCLSHSPPCQNRNVAMEANSLAFPTSPR